MHNIKFRQARCGAKGNFVDWFYWGFLDDGSGFHFVAPLQHNVDNFQFIGLKDKNGKGKEIYVGMGGIHPEYGKFIVCLGLYLAPDGKKHCGFYIEWQDKRAKNMLTPRLPIWLEIEDEDMVFDMNIHQHPNLMEQACHKES